MFIAAVYFNIRFLPSAALIKKCQAQRRNDAELHWEEDEPALWQLGERRPPVCV